MFTDSAWLKLLILQLCPPAGISCGNWWQWCWSRQPGRTPSPGLCSFSCSPAAFTRWRPAAPTPLTACRHVRATSASSSTTPPSASTAWVCGPSLRAFSSTPEASDAVLLTQGDYWHYFSLWCCRFSHQLFGVYFPRQVGERCVPSLVPGPGCAQHSRLHRPVLLLQVTSRPPAVAQLRKLLF